ncbi:hypothetical protein H6G65_08105 [Microcystis elabens FACHB-917]|nr:hypothetical protein [Microcystis elabens FACHB-917]
MASGCFPHPFEGSFSAFKERQLVFALTRELADAQLRRSDRSRSERITGLLYGVQDHGDMVATDSVYRPYRERQREALNRARGRLARLARLTGRRPARTSGPQRSAGRKLQATKRP